MEFKDKILTELVKKSDYLFKSLKSSRMISEKRASVFYIKNKKIEKTTSVGKMCLVPKIHKWLYDVPG